jgi:hypothetical protein
MHYKNMNFPPLKREDHSNVSTTQVILLDYESCQEILFSPVWVKIVYPLGTQQEILRSGLLFINK